MCQDIILNKNHWETVMNSKQSKWVILGLIFILLAGSLLIYRHTRIMSVKKVVQTAVDAYTYGYPLVTFDMARRQQTNVTTADGEHAPMNQMIKMRSYPAVDNHCCAAPNTDTLYTLAWLDVSGEPWVFSIPDMANRYYILPLLDGFSEVFKVISSSEEGGKAQTVAITGPDWSGNLPEGVIQVESPTAIVWILGRVYCDGTPEDYEAVHALQDRFELVPLSAYGKPYTPSPGIVDSAFDMTTAVREQVNSMDIYVYFNYLAHLLKNNPPKPEDTDIVARMAKIGLVPGEAFEQEKLRSLEKEAASSETEPMPKQMETEAYPKPQPHFSQGLGSTQGTHFDTSNLDIIDKGVIRLVPKIALLKMALRLKRQQTTNGWLYFTEGVGNFGTDYELRGMANLLGPGWNRPEDAVYPISQEDADGNAYDGAKHSYILRFEKGGMPPVDGFWSLTLYDKDLFFVPNAIDRYTLSQRDNLVTNPDGSVDVYIQAESPGQEKAANWLPAPKGEFKLVMRLYGPPRSSPTILDGSWTPPPVRQVPFLTY